MVEPVGTPEVTPEHFDRTFDTNARGAYFTVQKALPLVNDGASIILTSSTVWQKGVPIYGTYAAAQGRPSLIRSDLDGRVRAPRNPRERDQCRCSRNAHV
jgi:NADP-dependent 3-hydroxy acid dehydrogenase YdfG